MDLVKLLDIDDDFIIDLKYATPDNFTGAKVYNSGECWIHKDTAQMLIKARDMFKKDGYRVKVLDAYRPISAQKRFWEIMPDDRYVGDPRNISSQPPYNACHLNGLAVDVTLTDMDGNEIPMPSKFDDMSKRASFLNIDLNTEGGRNAAYLREVMEKCGFAGYDEEWWHFYNFKTEPGPCLDFQI